MKKKTIASFNLSNLRRPTREKDDSGIAVKMTAKLQGPERTKAKERIPRPHLQIDGGSDKTISPGRSRAMLSGMEPLCTCLPLPSSPLHERGPSGSRDPFYITVLSTSHALGKTVRILLHLAFGKCVFTQLGTRECLCTQVRPCIHSYPLRIKPPHHLKR